MNAGNSAFFALIDDLGEAEALRLLNTRLTLDHYGLSPQDAENRRSFIGGSDARILTRADADEVLDLWRGKVGMPLAKPKKFEDVLHIQMGHITENLNRLWFQKKTGHLVHSAGGQYRCGQPGLGFMGSSQDGRTEIDGREIGFEAKHVNGFGFDMEETIATYWPQLQHNMFVMDLEAFALSVLIGTGGHRWELVEADPLYQAELVSRERTFWEAVETRSPPSPLPELADAVERSVTVDMTGNNEWASAAHDFITHKDGAKLFDTAKAKLKSLVPLDAKECKGHGIVTKVSANGTVSSDLSPELKAAAKAAAKPTTPKKGKKAA